MNLTIISPDKEIFSGEADSVVLPGSDGKLGVLNNHAPMIASLTKGEVKVKSGKGEELFEISGGVVEVLKNKVIILAE